MSKLTYASSFRAGYNKASNDILKILTHGDININNLEKAVNFIRKKLDKTDIPKDIKCKFCDSLLNPNGEIKNGVCQIGQGKNRPIISFCNEEHRNLFEAKNTEDAILGADV